MKYKYLGDTGVAVSQLALGTLAFGGEADEAMSRAMFERSRDLGINFFDTANIYQKGRSEEVLGQLISSCRDEVVIATKAYYPTGPDVNAQGASRRHLVRSVQESLRRLRTDRIDLLYLHHWDGRTALEETLRALDDLIRNGTVLYAGASNFAAWQVEKALGIAEAKNLIRFKAIQPMYNLVKRQAEVEILPMAQTENLAVFPYSPTAGGLLSGKYGKAAAPGSGRIADYPLYTARYRADFETAERFAIFARERAFEPTALAVAWVASHPGVTAPLIGARNVTQLEGSLASLSIDMTPELHAEIAALTPAPPPATDRSEEVSGEGLLVR